MADAPSVELSFTPAGPEFSITEDCVMPTITAIAALKNYTPNAKAPVPLVFSWKATLIFKDAGCSYSCGRVIKHPELTQQGLSEKFPLKFTQVRGGDLTVSVTVTGGTLNVSKSSEKLKIIGTNPSVGTLTTYVQMPSRPGFRKLMRLESGLKQFRSPSCPLFSSDNFGGVGICQITKPAPSDDEVWSWKANVAAGWKLYQSKEQEAKNYVKNLKTGAEFQALVKAYNDNRIAKAKAAAAVTPGVAGTAGAQPTSAPTAPVPGLQPPPAGAGEVKPLTIELPDYTDEQLERDTLRGFNGWAGQLHEYKVKVDANGLLVVTMDASGLTGKAEWQLVTAADRTAYYDKIGLDQNKRGDPNYVDDVEKLSSF
jgi:hypothetical protein